MTLDSRTPIIVGAGQTLQRPAAAADAASPADLMAEALRLAGNDTTTGTRLLTRADSVRVVDQMSWRYVNAAAEVARLVGAKPRQTVLTTVGGNSPQMLVNQTAIDILAAKVDVALICGAEAIFSRRLARRTGELLSWRVQGEDVAPPDLVLGTDRPGTNESEQARSLVLPSQVYPIFECSLRAAANERVEEHQLRISQLWARFSSVAATNPYAWSPTPRTAEEIRTVSPHNRMVAFPYPKLMNANLQTDQAAALIMCSVQAARDAGIPSERWVFPWSGADAHDHWFVSDRWDLCSSPAIEACGRAAFALAGIGIGDVSHVDLYSCFPSAVQIGASALKFPLDDPARPPTVTGGLSFAGGPGNNYTTHAIATMIEHLRAEPTSKGLITALGWYATKHSLGVYSGSPPPSAFAHRDLQDEVDSQPARGPDPSFSGQAQVEAATVVYERDGSRALGIVACLTPAGRRAWGNTRDPDVSRSLEADDVVGRTARLDPDGTFDLS